MHHLTYNPRCSRIEIWPTKPEGFSTPLDLTDFPPKFVAEMLHQYQPMIRHRLAKFLDPAEIGD